VPIVILGAGPAGLGAALKLAQRGTFDVTVLERGASVGGNSASFDVDGIRVDFGSHRLHPACSADVMQDIRGMLGDDLLERPRHGRILLRGRWVHFPLKPFDLVSSLPPSFMLGFARDALVPRRPARGEETFATVLEQGLGRTICRDFYFPYATKIWGVGASELDAEQARRRVSANSKWRLVSKVLRALLPSGERRGAHFFYPRDGFGQISDAYHSAAVEAGAVVRFDTTAAGIETDNGRAIAVRTTGPDGETRIDSRMVLSTIPLPALANAVSPGPPEEVRESLGALRYRAMVLIYLTLGTDQFTEYDAHYFPGTDVVITRLSEPKNYSLTSLPGSTVLCAELPCSVGDQHWKATEDELGQLVLDALDRAGLTVTAPLRGVIARRLSHAYPIYSRGYQEHFERIDDWVGGIGGLVSLGRQGLFAHDNTHHTLAMAYAADECLDDNGRLDAARWAENRHRFESHVVED